MPIAIEVEDHDFYVDLVTTTLRRFDSNGLSVELSAILDYDHNY